ncbi:MAG: hypothetical protein H3C49_11655 [Alphaproteobacteria bacterium]|nr:hypothetical protein [Alphaproteobacteria bacterium]
MIAFSYRKALGFCFSAAILITLTNYLFTLDKVRMLYGVFLLLRALVVISLFYAAVKIWLLPKHLASTLRDSSWFIRCFIWLFVMLAAAVAIAVSGLPILLQLSVHFVASIFDLTIQPKASSYIMFSMYGLPAGIAGGFCLWALLRKTFNMDADTSVIWRRYIVWASIISAYAYFIPAITFDLSYPRGSCAFEKEYSALVFLSGAAILFGACFRAWHLTAPRIISGLQNQKS